MNNNSISFEINKLRICLDKNSQIPTLETNSKIIIEPGDKILIIGESGSGKTIFLKSIACLFDHKIVEFIGSFCYSGQLVNFQSYKIYKKNIKKIFGRYLCMLHQDAINHLHPYRSIASQLSECYFGDKKAKKINIVNSCNDVDLVRLINSEANRNINNDYNILSNTKRINLSGGMCQRVGIASVLIQEPMLVIADEPLSDLDITSRNTIKKLLFNKILNNKQTTVLFATHDPVIISQNTIFNKLFLTHDNTITQITQIPKKWNNCSLDKNENIILSNNKPKETILFSKMPVKYKYPDSNHWAVDTASQKYNINIVKGQHLGIVGETGSGKSTLARLISFLIRTESNFFLMNKNFKKQSFNDSGNLIYNNIQVVFQDTLGSINTKETIESGIKRLKKKRGFNDIIVKNLLDDIGLSYNEISTKYPFELSMGMLRRFFLVKAYLGLTPIKKDEMPKILILDEITRGLDPINRKRVFDFLINLNSQDITIIAISHDLDFVQKLCNHIIVMYNGWIVEEKIFNDKISFKQINWKHPYSKTLWNKSELKILTSSNIEKACKFFKYCKQSDLKKCLVNANINKQINGLNGWHFCIS